MKTSRKKWYKTDFYRKMVDSKKMYQNSYICEAIHFILLGRQEKSSHKSVIQVTPGGINETHKNKNKKKRPLIPEKYRNFSHNWSIV
jgi:hypothetical protein